MISVERIMQYSNIPSGAPLLIDSSRLSHNWPSTGTIVLKNLEVGATKPNWMIYLKPYAIENLTLSWECKRKRKKEWRERKK